MAKQVETLTGELKKMACEALLSLCRNTVHYENLADMTLDTVESLMKGGHLPARDVAGNLDVLIKFDRGRINDARYVRIQKLRESLFSGSDIETRFQKYAGMLSFDSKEDPKRIAEAKEFSKELLQDTAQIYKHLKWLFSEKAENAYELGLFLSEIDSKNEIVRATIDYFEKNHNAKSTAFLGGLLRGTFLKDQKTWEILIFSISNKVTLHKFFIDLIWRSGFTENIMKVILDLIRRKDIQPEQLGNVAFGGVFGGVSQALFDELIGLLLEQNRPRCTAIALQILFNHYVHQKKESFPLHPTFEVLTHPTLFLNDTDEKFDQMVDYYWTETANRFYKLHPDKDIELADALIEGFGHNNSIVGGFDSLPLSVLNILAANHPKEVWARISSLLDPPVTRGTYYLTRWLEKGLHYFPIDLVLEWVTVSPEERAPYIAEIVPKVIFGGDADKSLARQLLVRFGDRKGVQEALSHHYLSGLIQGSQSVHYVTQLASFDKMEMLETDAKVLEWIRLMKESLQGSIRRARVSEERRGF